MDKKRLIKFSCIGVAIVVIIISIIFLGNGNTAQNNTTDTLTSSELLVKAEEALNNTTNKNILYIVYTGDEDGEVVFTNKLGETLVQEPNGVLRVHRKDNMEYYFSEDVYYMSNLNEYTIIKSILDSVKAGTLELHEIDFEENKDAGVLEIYVDVRGMANIKQLYANIDADLAERMEAQYTEQLKELEVDGDLNFRFLIMVNESTKMIESAACYVYFGDIPVEEVKWEELGANWIFDGITIVKEDWSLDESWYTLDLSTIEQSEEGEKQLADMIEKQFTEAAGIIERHLDELEQLADKSGHLHNNVDLDELREAEEAENTDG